MNNKSDNAININDHRIKIGMWSDPRGRLTKIQRPFFEVLKEWLTTSSDWNDTIWTYVKDPLDEKALEDYIQRLQDWCKANGITENRIIKNYDTNTQCWVWYWYPPHDHCTKRELKWYGLKDNQVVLLENTSD